MQPDSIAPAQPLREAKQAIWRLFESGYVDEDTATASLLALDLGSRRQRRKQRLLPPPDRQDGTSRAA